MTTTTLKDRLLEIASVTSVKGIDNVVGMVALIAKNKTQSDGKRRGLLGRC